MEEEQKGGPSTTLETPPASPAAGADDLVSIRTKLEESERRRSGLDREVTRLQQERTSLLAAAARGGISQDVLSRLGDLELSLAELKDAQGITEEGTGTALSHKEQLLQKRKEAVDSGQREQKIQWEARITSVWEDVVDHFQALGVPIEAVHQDGQFLFLWKQGDLRGAKQRAYAVAAGKAPSASTAKTTEEAEETEEQRIDRLAEEKYRQTIRDRGLLKVETTNSPGTGKLTTFTEEQLQDREFWTANKEAIQKAQREGTFKIK